VGTRRVHSLLRATRWYVERVNRDDYSAKYRYQVVGTHNGNIVRVYWHASSRMTLNLAARTLITISTITTALSRSFWHNHGSLHQSIHTHRFCDDYW